MNRLLSFFFILTLALGLEAASASDDVLRLAPGGRASIKLSENPSTGYSWRVDRSQSSNIDILRIDDLGFARAGGKRIGAPGTHAWSVEALSAGRAVVAFVYRRPWENAPVRTHRVTVEVKRR
jgi:predicted secreted protein